MVSSVSEIIRANSRGKDVLEIAGECCLMGSSFALERIGQLLSIQDPSVGDLVELAGLALALATLKHYHNEQLRKGNVDVSGE
jgi:hypothetical protein